MLSSLLYVGCTNLEEKVFDTISTDTFFRTEPEFLAALVPVYANLRSIAWAYYNINQHTSDETMVPQRGGDWGDNGKWRQLHQHTWDKSHPDINDAWNNAYDGVARVNYMIPQFEKAPETIKSKKRFIAELKFLRAFHYYMLIDFFGGVPIVTVPRLDFSNLPARNTRQEVFDFIIKETTESINDLPATVPDVEYGRVTKGTANALLAKMYLNAGVWTGTPQWQKAVDACNAVINSGNYKLSPKYFDNFVVSNQKSPENIFVAPSLAQDGLGLTMNMRTLHYNQHPQSPWNGFCTIAEYYNSFDKSDERFKIFLSGQAFDVLTGAPVNNRQGAPLIFTLDVPMIGANENNGIRVLKWAVDPAQLGGHAGNDYAIFRYADILLIKAEALNELNGPTAESVGLVNSVRARVFSPEKPISPSNKDGFRTAILAERGFELGWEGIRRQDLIRHGKFQNAWSNKAVSEGFRNLFAIPQFQIDTNPKLAQNPGY